MRITVPKIGTGRDDDPIRPGTDVENWKVVEEHKSEFVVEIIDANKSHF